MRLFGIILLFLIFYGCNKEKQKAPDAFFVKPQSVSLAVTSTSVQGTTNSKITDLWYYVNGKFKGAYPVTSIMPIPSTGPTDIVFYAGIKNNGISDTRQPYEFYNPITFDTAVSPETVINKTFVFNYKPTTKFHWLEDFEGGVAGTSIKKSNNSDTTFAILDKTVPPYPDVYEGKKCFYFALDDIRQIGQFESSFTYNLPKNGAPVYLEINYKCTGPFDVGVFGGINYQFVGGINTSYDWNKIYIQLSTGVSSNTTYNYMGVYFRAHKQFLGGVAEFWIDNIKVLSY